MNFKPYAVFFLTAGLLLSPAALRGAQRGGHPSGRPAFTPPPPPPSASIQRSNEGGRTRGLERAEESQEMNTRADKNRGFTVAPGVEKAEQKVDRDNDDMHRHHRHHMKKAKKHKKHGERANDGDNDRDDK